MAKAVRDVTADGVAYFSSAANSNKIIGGQNVASYEATSFRPTTCPAAVVTHYGAASISCHDFNPGAGVDALYGFSYNGDLAYSMGWSEPQNGVATNLNLCLYNVTASTLVGCSEAANSSTGLPFEYSSWSSVSNLDRAWVVVRYNSAGTPRFKLISHRSDLTAVEYNTSLGGDIVGPTIFGHNASIPGVTVAAVPYNNSSVLESYSSFGPALYCWQPVNGVTPSGPLTPCQSTTVDVSATDGGQNSFFGSGSPPRFYGTSAAAPHAAAVAALALQDQPCLSQQAVVSALQTSGRPVGTAPVNGAGSGLIDAVAALVDADCRPPLVNPGPATGWYRAASISATASAQDNRRVAAMSCSGASVTAPTGLNTGKALTGWTATGDGHYTVTCSATDSKGNSGGPAAISFGIDTVAPSVQCRPTKIPFRRGGTVAADVTDALSGPVTVTTSSRVSGKRTGRFDVTLTGSDVAGNTVSVQCRYRVVVKPLLKGPSKAKASAKKTFTVSGLPSKAKVTWTVKAPGARQVTTVKANKRGVAKLRLRPGSKGKYVISAKAGGKSVRKVVRVQ